MQNLISSNFSRTYNPSGNPNALTDIKRLLISRDTKAQNKACGYLTDVVSRYDIKSDERVRVVEYLLDNDITVFLCEATSNLDTTLFRSVLGCLRLLFLSPSYFGEQHAAQCASAVLRALAHYAAAAPPAADAAAHFLCDLLHGVEAHNSTAPLSHQSAYSADQLLACLNSIAHKIAHRPNAVLSSALVLHALVSYQPVGLKLQTSTASALAEVLGQWFALMMGALNHCTLVDDESELGAMFYAVLCQLGMDALRLSHLLHQHGKPKVNFVYSILSDEADQQILIDSGAEILKSVHQLLLQLINFTKEHHSRLPGEEYGVFLRLLLAALAGARGSDLAAELFFSGYLQVLPRAQVARKDLMVRKASTLVLGEILKSLSHKYLHFDDEDNSGNHNSADDIHLGLVELQNAIETPNNLGQQLQERQSYSLLIYIYFYCQSADNPQELTGPLLPFLIEHILRIPAGFVLPKYVIKALWLVFAMSTISNESLKSLNERIQLEKAVGKLVGILHPHPGVYYTHHPALLLWCFTSSRITDSVKVNVLSKWLEIEDSLPADLLVDAAAWGLLLSVAVRSADRGLALNTSRALNARIEEASEELRQEFAESLWAMLPGILSKYLVSGSRTESNICYVLELAISLMPPEMDMTICVKVSLLLSTMFTSDISEQMDEEKYHYQYVCLKLSLHLLSLACDNNDNRVLVGLSSRAGFLPAALAAGGGAGDAAAGAALALLAHVVHRFTRNDYQPKSLLQVESTYMLRLLREDRAARSGPLLQLLYCLLSAGACSPLVLAYSLPDVPSERQMSTALRILMFRIQMLCCKQSQTQSSAAWKTLSAIFKHAIVSKNDTQLVARLTTQPWTHVLVQFQLSQGPSPEFLAFVANWLTLLKITINKDKTSRGLFKLSVFYKVVVMLKKRVVVDDKDDLKEGKEKVLAPVNEILCLAQD